MWFVLWQMYSDNVKEWYNCLLPSEQFIHFNDGDQNDDVHFVLY